MNLENYLSSIADKSALIAGIGVSNLPLMRLLHTHGVRLAVWDKGSAAALGDTARELEALSIPAFLDGAAPDGVYDVVFRSPGVRPDTPELSAQTAKGACMTSEMELFMSVCPCKIIAVTGSDGKTTTSTLIAEMLSTAGFTVHLGGNIGTPLLGKAGEMGKDDFAVVELSSFQLMTMNARPDVAVVTNVAPNHLDWHRDMDEYINAKRRLFASQTLADLLVVNKDCGITRGFMDNAAARTLCFSRKTDADACLDGGWLSFAGARLFEASDILLPGVHNIENYLAAIASVSDYVPQTAMRRVAASFKGVPHRIELVRELDGVRYYNDSIASSPTRAIAGLRSFPEPVILIAGGSDKKIPFDTFAEEICGRVKALYLTGDTAEKIKNAVEALPNHPPIIVTDALSGAVTRAHDRAKPGDVVILSPACASFDRYKNFAHRGEVFKGLVNAL